MPICNEVKDKAIASIMADIPKVDYIAKAFALMEEVAVSSLPSAAKDLYNGTLTRKHLRTHSAPCVIETGNGNCPHREIFGLLTSDMRNTVMESGAVTQLQALEFQQHERLHNIEEFLFVNFSAYESVEQVHKAFPQLAKYMTDEGPRTDAPDPDILISLLRTNDLAI